MKLFAVAAEQPGRGTLHWALSVSGLHFFLSELLVSRHLLEGIREEGGREGRASRDGQRPIAEDLVEVSMFSVPIQHLIISALDSLIWWSWCLQNVHRRSCWVQSYTVKLGCQAYLGFVSKSWPVWIHEEKAKQRYKHNFNDEVLEKSEKYFGIRISFEVSCTHTRELTSQNTTTGRKS